MFLNKSSIRWNAVTAKGIARKVVADEVIPLKDGINFTIADETIATIANR